jgi:outer membrane protein insertion porin family
VILPIVNAPFRLYYAYNPLRLYRNLPQQLAVDGPTFRDMFPKANPACISTSTAPCALTGAGEYTYEQAIQFYGADYTLREPRKTFRLTVSTTF